MVNLADDHTTVTKSTVMTFLLNVMVNANPIATRDPTVCRPISYRIGLVSSLLKYT